MANVSRTWLGRMFSWEALAVKPPPRSSLAVYRVLLIALILSIPPLAWRFLATSSSAVWVRATMLKDEITSSTRTARRIERTPVLRGLKTQGKQRQTTVLASRRVCQGGVSRKIAFTRTVDPHILPRNASRL